MKLKYIFIPAILITILVVGICKHYYDLDLLSMDHVCMISIASFVAFFTVFFGISVCAYEASKMVAEKQTEHIDRDIRLLVQHINECFKAHDALTKNLVTQQSIKLVETVQKVAEIIISGDDERAKVLTDLLLDIKQLSLTTRDNMLIVKTSALNTEKLVEESMERLDNVLICLRGNNVEDVGEEKDVEVAIEKLYNDIYNLKKDEVLTDVDNTEDNEVEVVEE